MGVIVYAVITADRSFMPFICESDCSAVCRLFT